MKLKVKIDGTAFTPAKRAGFQIEPLKLDGKIMVVLPQKGKDEYTLPPELLAKGELLIEVNEVGGREAGYAQIVTGGSGNEMHAFYRAHKLGPCESSAHFTLGGGECVTVYATAKDVAIREHVLVFPEKAGTVKVVTILRWKGDPKKLPPTLRRFEPAVTAAVAKARCSGCTHCHYAAANRPGARVKVK